MHQKAHTTAVASNHRNSFSIKFQFLLLIYERNCARLRVWANKNKVRQGVVTKKSQSGNDWDCTDGRTRSICKYLE